MVKHFVIFMITTIIVACSYNGVKELEQDDTMDTNTVTGNDQPDANDEGALPEGNKTDETIDVDIVENELFDTDMSLDEDIIDNCSGSFPNQHDGLCWSDKSLSAMPLSNAKYEYCVSLGGKLPTISELRTLIRNCPATEPDGLCGVTDSCSTGSCCSPIYCGSCIPDELGLGKYSVFGDVDWLWSRSDRSDDSYYAWRVDFYSGNVDYNHREGNGYVRCVTDIVHAVSWKTHDGLEWSDLSPSVKIWTEAVNYCASIGGRLPSISELRTLIQNCTATETDGACKVTDSCLSTSCYTSLSCNACENAVDGRYSVFGDSDFFWSSSSVDNNTNNAWFVRFNSGYVYGSKKTNKYSVRCVR